MVNVGQNFNVWGIAFLKEKEYGVSRIVYLRRPGVFCTGAARPRAVFPQTVLT